MPTNNPNTGLLTKEAAEGRAADDARNKFDRSDKGKQAVRQDVELRDAQGDEERTKSAARDLGLNDEDFSNPVARATELERKAQDATAKLPKPVDPFLPASESSDARSFRKTAESTAALDESAKLKAQAAALKEVNAALEQQKNLKASIANIRRGPEADELTRNLQEQSDIREDVRKKPVASGVNDPRNERLVTLQKRAIEINESVSTFRNKEQAVQQESAQLRDAKRIQALKELEISLDRQIASARQQGLETATLEMEKQIKLLQAQRDFAPGGPAEKREAAAEIKKLQTQLASPANNTEARKKAEANITELEAKRDSLPKTFKLSEPERKALKTEETQLQKQLAQQPKTEAEKQAITVKIEGLEKKRDAQVAKETAASPEKQAIAAQITQLKAEQNAPAPEAAAEKQAVAAQIVQLRAEQNAQPKTDSEQREVQVKIDALEAKRFLPTTTAAERPVIDRQIADLKQERDTPAQPKSEAEKQAIQIKIDGLEKQLAAPAREKTVEQKKAIQVKIEGLQKQLTASPVASTIERNISKLTQERDAPAQTPEERQAAQTRIIEIQKQRTESPQVREINGQIAAQRKQPAEPGLSQKQQDEIKLRIEVLLKQLTAPIANPQLQREIEVKIREVEGRKAEFRKEAAIDQERNKRLAAGDFKGAQSLTDLVNFKALVAQFQANAPASPERDAVQAQIDTLEKERDAPDRTPDQRLHTQAKIENLEVRRDAIVSSDQDAAKRQATTAFETGLRAETRQNAPTVVVDSLQEVGGGGGSSRVQGDSIQQRVTKLHEEGNATLKRIEEAVGRGSGRIR